MLHEKIIDELGLIWVLNQETQHYEYAGIDTNNDQEKNND